MLQFALALFAIQAGFHGFSAALPLALARGGVPDPQIGLIVGIHREAHGLEAHTLYEVEEDA